MSESEVSYYDRTHARRKCRELCAEYGFSGDAFNNCVSACLKELLRKKNL